MDILRAWHSAQLTSQLQQAALHLKGLRLILLTFVVCASALAADPGRTAELEAVNDLRSGSSAAKSKHAFRPLRLLRRLGRAESEFGLRLSSLGIQREAEASHSEALPRSSPSTEITAWVPHIGAAIPAPGAAGQVLANSGRIQKRHVKQSASTTAAGTTIALRCRQQAEAPRKEPRKSGDSLNFKNRPHPIKSLAALDLLGFDTNRSSVQALFSFKNYVFCNDGISTQRR